jgi:hypothetical protein
MAHPYKIKRINADVVVPDASDEGVTITLQDHQLNGLLRGVIINVPSMSANQPVNKVENVTVAESVTLVRT